MIWCIFLHRWHFSKIWVIQFFCWLYLSIYLLKFNQMSYGNVLIIKNYAISIFLAISQRVIFLQLFSMFSIFTVSQHLLNDLYPNFIQQRYNKKWSWSQVWHKLINKWCFENLFFTIFFWMDWITLFNYVKVLKINNFDSVLECILQQMAQW